MTPSRRQVLGAAAGVALPALPAAGDGGAGTDDAPAADPLPAADGRPWGREVTAFAQVDLPSVALAVGSDDGGLTRVPAALRVHAARAAVRVELATTTDGEHVGLIADLPPAPARELARVAREQPDASVTAPGAWSFTFPDHYVNHETTCPAGEVAVNVWGPAVVLEASDPAVSIMGGVDDGLARAPLAAALERAAALVDGEE